MTGYQVEEVPCHRYVDNIRRPNLVDPVDPQLPEQVGMDFLVPRGWLAGVGTPVDGLQAH